MIVIFFKDDLKEKHRDKNPSFYFKDLEETIDILYSVNNDLVKIFSKEQEIAKSVK